MIKRSTWIMLVVLVLAVAVYFIFRAVNSATPIAATPTSLANSYLITPADGTLESLRISDDQNHVTQLQRNSSGTWIITLPQFGNADPSLAGAFESQVQALRIVSTLNESLDPVSAGFYTPRYTLILTFSGQSEHTIQVGSMTPSNSGYYVRFDGSTFYVIAKAGIDSLANLVTSPPYTATETPAITDTPTSTLLSVTPTPEAWIQTQTTATP